MALAYHRPLELWVPGCPGWSAYLQLCPPACPVLASWAWLFQGRREPGPHTHLLDALQSVIGLLDVPVHRIHSGRFAGFYRRAMNVVQPVKTEGSGCHCRPHSHPLALVAASRFQGSLQAMVASASGSSVLEGGTVATAAQPFCTCSPRGAPPGLKAAGTAGCSLWTADVSTAQACLPQDVELHTQVRGFLHTCVSGGGGEDGNPIFRFLVQGFAHSQWVCACACTRVGGICVQ